MVLRLAIDLKLFDAVIHHSSQSETGKVTVNQIATDTKADPILVGQSIHSSQSKPQPNQTSRPNHALPLRHGNPQTTHR